MDAPLYLQILQQMLLPFLKSVYPDGHHCMADNDPKHTSSAANDFLKSKSVIGGESWLNLLTVTQWKTFGMG